MDITVEVGARQGEDQCTIGVAFAEATYRAVTAPCVEGQTDIEVSAIILAGHIHPVAQTPQDTCPSGRGDPVALSGSPGGRRDQIDLHVFSAQVRNPTRMSCRSGVWKLR